MWKNIVIIALLLIIASGVIYFYSIQPGGIKKPPMDGEIVMEDSLFLRPEFREFLDKYIETINHNAPYEPKVIMIFTNGRYLSPSEDWQMEQSFVITYSKYRSSVEFRRPIGYFRYKNYPFLICSSLYSMMGDRNGIMKNIENDLKKLWQGSPMIYDPATWEVNIKIRGKKVIVEYEPFDMDKEPRLPKIPIPFG